jgi:arsenate reductase-like glutaredoxin family protein
MEALAWDRPELRERLRAVNDQWRSLLRDALAEAIDEYGLDESHFSAEALAALVMQFQKGLLNERLLGFDRGHAELLSAIDRWLASLEKRAK